MDYFFYDKDADYLFLDYNIYHLTYQSLNKSP